MGLTGSIGMGKSTAATMLRKMGYPVFDADAIVRQLTSSQGSALPDIAHHFPEFFKDGEIRRKELAQRVFQDEAARKKLERILHPLVHRAREKFLSLHRGRRSEVVFLDIPLLYETGLERICDFVFLVTAPAFLQKDRVLARPGMNEALFEKIRSTQMQDWEKRRRADTILQSGLGRAFAWRELKKIIGKLNHA